MITKMLFIKNVGQKILINIFFHQQFFYQKKLFHKNLITKKILCYGYYLNAKKYLKRDKCGQTRINMMRTNQNVFLRLFCLVGGGVVAINIVFAIDIVLDV